MNKLSRSVCIALGLGLAGCATYPTGPSMMALPGGGASFDQFRADDVDCQAYAAQTTGLTAQQSAENSGANSAAVGTVLGAAAGALIGAASGDAAAGAAIGGGSGLLLGAAGGTDAYGASGYMAQDRYDNAYVQCMYARGHQVPVSASTAAQLNAMQSQTPAPAYSAPPPGSAVPPANAGYPPPGTPPPPGY